MQHPSDVDNTQGYGGSPSETPTLVFFGHFGARNWGNECTLLACISNVRRLHPDARLICLSSKPADTFQRYGLQVIGLVDAQRSGTDIRSRRQSRLRRLVQLILAQPRNLVTMLFTLRRADMLIMTGTGMITDWGEGPLGLPLSMWQWCTLAALLRRPARFLSVGVERIEHPLARWLLRRALGRACYRSFRDDHSRSQLVRAHIPVASDPVYPDLAFSLPVSEAAGSAHIPGTVSVGVFSHRSRGEGGAEALAAYQAYVDKLGHFILFLFARKQRVRLVTGDASDIAVLEDLKAWLAPHEPPPFMSEPADSVEHVMQQLGEADVVVATRFHNVVLALRMGIPVLSIAYEGKNDVLMAAMGLGEYCQSIDTLDVGQLISQFEQVSAQASLLSQHIKARVGEYQQQLDVQYDRVFGASAKVDQQPTPTYSREHLYT